VGQGGGPTLIGILSQFLSGSWQMGPMRSLQTALLCALTLYVVGGLLVLLAGRYFIQDIANLRAFDEGRAPATKRDKWGLPGRKSQRQPQ